MSRYLPPFGYRLPSQAYSRYGYDGQLWVPSKLGALSVLLPGSVSIDFSQFFAPGTVLQSVQTDKGLRPGSTLTWADQSGNGFNYSQAVAGKQPTITAGVNGNPGLLCTLAGTQLLTSGLTLPAPGTTPTWIGMVWRNVAVVNTGRPLSDTSTGISDIVYMSANDTNLRQFNGAAGNIANMTLGTLECDEFYFSNSASDYIKRGSNAVVTGTSAGNGVGVGRNIGGNDATTSYTTAEYFHVIYVAGAPQVAAIAKWKAAVKLQYGSSLNVG